MYFSNRHNPRDEHDAAEMMIWITDLKGVRLPFRAAALVYKFMVRVVCETDLQWTLVCPSSYEGSSMRFLPTRKSRQRNWTIAMRLGSYLDL